MQYFNSMIAAGVMATAGALDLSAGSDTNTFAVYVGKKAVATTAIKNGPFYPEGLGLDAKPALTGADFESYDIATHTFVLKADAGRRFVQEWRAKSPAESVRINPEIQVIEGPDLPFLICANGKPVYAGMLSNSQRLSLLSCSMHAGYVSKPYPVMQPRNYAIPKGEQVSVSFSISPASPNIQTAAQPMVPGDTPLPSGAASVVPVPNDPPAEAFHRVAATESAGAAFPDVRSDKSILEALRKLKLSP